MRESSMGVAFSGCTSIVYLLVSHHEMRGCIRFCFSLIKWMFAHWIPLRVHVRPPPDSPPHLIRSGSLSDFISYHARTHHAFTTLSIHTIPRFYLFLLKRFLFLRIYIHFIVDHVDFFKPLV